jgi:hypothetical protein
MSAQRNRVSSALSPCSAKRRRRISADKPGWTEPRGFPAGRYGDCKAERARLVRLSSDVRERAAGMPVARAAQVGEQARIGFASWRDRVATGSARQSAADRTRMSAVVRRGG